MARPYRRVLLATAIAVIGAVRLASAPTYKPVEQLPFTVDTTRRVPPSFDSLWSQSTMVVEGVVEKTVPLAVRPGPRSAVTVRIVEVFKGDTRSAGRGAELELVMDGSVTDRGAYVEWREDPDAPLLRRNQRPILFLRLGDVARAFELATGTHDSLYLVDGASIASRGRSPVARQLADQSHGQFAARLRARRDAD